MQVVHTQAVHMPEARLRRSVLLRWEDLVAMVHPAVLPQAVHMQAVHKLVAMVHPAVLHLVAMVHPAVLHKAAASVLHKAAASVLHPVVAQAVHKPAVPLRVPTARRHKVRPAFSPAVQVPAADSPSRDHSRSLPRRNSAAGQRELTVRSATCETRS